jgi:membrane dipeptidase
MQPTQFGAPLDRRAFLELAAALAAAGCSAPPPPPPPASSGSPLKDPAKGPPGSPLDRFFSIDMHTHPGPFYGSGDVLAKLKAFQSSKLTALVYSVLSDLAVLDMTGPPRVTREPKPGELHASTVLQLKEAREHLDRLGIRVALTASDLVAAGERGEKAAVLAIEGADFADEDLGRVAEVYQLGARILQPLHYRVNAFGDNQTTPPIHAGLSEKGRELIREANRLGMIVDAAHMTLPAYTAAAETSRTPVLWSHTMVVEADSRRLIGEEYAKLIAAKGGVIGMWSTPFPRGVSFEEYVAWIAKTIRLLGPDHVGLGTDIDSVPGPFRGYEQLPALIEGLSAAGIADEGLEKFLGGSFLRLFQAAGRAGAG